MNNGIDAKDRAAWQELAKMAVTLGNPVVVAEYGVGPTPEAARIGGARIENLEEQLENGERISVKRIRTNGSVVERMFARRLITKTQKQAADLLLADFYLVRGGQRLGINYDPMPARGCGEDMSARRLDAKARLDKLYFELTPDRAKPIAWNLLERIVVDGEALVEAGAVFAGRWKSKKQTTAAVSVVLGDALDRVAVFYGLT